MTIFKRFSYFLLVASVASQLTGCATSFKTADEFRNTFFSDTYEVDRDFNTVMKHVDRQAKKCLNTKIRLTKTSNGNVIQESDHVFESEVKVTGDVGQLGMTKIRYVAGTSEVIYGPNYAYVVDFKALDGNKTQITTYSTFIVYEDLNDGLKAWAEKGATGCPDLGDLTRMAYM